jgi:DNA-binding transcriptional regulator YiaG
MVTVHKWDDIKKNDKTTPDSRAKAKADHEREVVAYSIAELRRSLEVTQQDLAAALDINQSAVSKIERSDDLSVSRLRSVAEALGGQLEINVRIDGILLPLNVG